MVQKTKNSNKKKQPQTHLLIFPNYFIPHIGGVETHVDEFSKYLSYDESYKITIFVPNIPVSKEREIRHNNVRVLRYPAFELIPNWPFPKFWTFKFWELYGELKSAKQHHKNTIVMTRTRFFTNALIGVLFAKLRFKTFRHMHVEHGSSFVILESKIKSFMAYVYDQIFGRLVFFSAIQNVGVSKAVHTFLKKEFLPNKNVLVIRRGVDFEAYNDTLPQVIPKKYDKLVKIGFLGRLYKWKGVKNSIAAFKQLPEDVKKKCAFIIAGDGEDFDLLKKLAKGEPNIVFLGSIPFEQGIQFLKELDMYIHSAFPGGGLSNSLLQAMYCNCGIVASPHEGANEVIYTTPKKSTGILLKNNSPKALQKGIEKLALDKKLREKYAKQARLDIEEHFDWKNIVKRYKLEFEKVLKKK